MEFVPCLPPRDNELSEKIKRAVENIKDNWPFLEQRYKSKVLFIKMIM